MRLVAVCENNRVNIWRMQNCRRTALSLTTVANTSHINFMTNVS